MTQATVQSTPLTNSSWEPLQTPEEAAAYLRVQPYENVSPIPVQSSQPNSQVGLGFIEFGVAIVLWRYHAG